MERLAVQVFLSGLRDHKIGHSLILARPDQSVRVRRLDDSPEESIIDEVRRIIKQVLSEKNNRRIVKHLGHVQRHCKKGHSTLGATHGSGELKKLMQRSGCRFVTSKRLFAE